MLVGFVSLFRFVLPKFLPFVDSLRQISDISWLVCFFAHFAHSEFIQLLISKTIYFEPSQYQNMGSEIETRTLSKEDHFQIPVICIFICLVFVTRSDVLFGQS